MEKETFRPRGNISGPILPRYALTLKISLGAKMLYSLLCDYAGDKDHAADSAIDGNHDNGPARQSRSDDIALHEV